eukprot:4470206-Prymnesium_polylepis.1
MGDGVRAAFVRLRVAPSYPGSPGVWLVGQGGVCVCGGGSDAAQGCALLLPTTRRCVCEESAEPECARRT